MSMEDRDGWIWLDGEWLPWRDARVHVMTHTLHYGLGCFEGIRAYPTPQGPAIFRLEAHIERLFDSARILGLPMPFDEATVSAACCDATGKRMGPKRAAPRSTEDSVDSAPRLLREVSSSAACSSSPSKRQRWVRSRAGSMMAK